MNYWRMLMAMVLVCVAGLVFTGCEDDDDDPLVGTWQAVSWDGKPLPNGVSLTIVINDNGTGSATFVQGNDSSTDNFTWTKGEGVIVTVTNGETENVPYTLAGNTLTIILDGHPVVLNRR